MNLRLVKNSRLVSKLAPKSDRWPSDLPAPIFPDDTQAKALAVSFLRGLTTQDRVPVYPCDITTEQAHDLRRWLGG